MRYNKVSINDFFFSADGTDSENADFCKLTVSGLSPLKFSKTGNIQTSADGTPIMQLVSANKKGLPIEINVSQLYKEQFDYFLEMIETVISAENPEENPLEVFISGDTGEFTFGALPGIPEPVTFAEFTNGRILNVSFKFVTT